MTLPVSVMAPEVPVTVTVYVPGVVPAATTLLQTVVRLPHADMPMAMKTESIATTSLTCHPRRRAGIPSRNKQVRSVPPPVYQGTIGGTT